MYNSVVSEDFYFIEEAMKKINLLRDEGKTFTVDQMVDYGDICDGISISYIRITWEV